MRVVCIDNIGKDGEPIYITDDTKLKLSTVYEVSVPFLSKFSGEKLVTLFLDGKPCGEYKFKRFKICNRKKRKLPDWF